MCVCVEVLRLRRENSILLNRFLFVEREEEREGGEGRYCASHKLLRTVNMLFYSSSLRIKMTINSFKFSFCYIK